MLSSLGVLARQRVALFLIPRSFLTPVLGTRLLDYGYNCDSSDPWKDFGTFLCLLSLKYWAVCCVAGVCIARGQRFEESTSQFFKMYFFDINCDLFFVFVHFLGMNCPTRLHIFIL